MLKGKSGMERRAGLYLTVVFVGMSLGLISGCAFRQYSAPPQEPAATTTQQPSTPTTAAPRADSTVPPRYVMAPAPSAQWISEKYTDLPIPAAFNFNSNKSFVFMQGALRSADLTYDGSMSTPKLIRFYQDSMPANGWQLLRLTGMKMKTMTFLKGGERCEITIHSRINEENPRLSHTRLHIKLNPY